MKMGNTKGASGVVAILFLVAIATTASVVIYTWTIGYMGSIKPRSESPILIKVEALSIRGNHIVLYVRNLGEKETVVNTLYLLSPSGRAT